jgi:polysaccharide export outer membrane protein
VKTITFILIFILSACSSIYVPLEVSQVDGGANVAVIPLTSSSLLEANRSSIYIPRTIPAAFNTIAEGGSSLRGPLVLPVGPLQPEVRPSSLALRLPPTVARVPYLIGVGDVLVLATPAGGNSIEELTGLLAAQNRRQGYTVQGDGSITIPAVGRVQVGGSTLSVAEDAIFSSLIDSQIDPSFSVEISEFNSQRISIGGMVRNPSIVKISLWPVYLNEALASVGGIETADPEFSSVRIYRNGELYQIPMTDFNSNGQLQRLELLDGDSVFVDSEFRLDRAKAYFEQQIRIVELQNASRESALAELNAEVLLKRSELSEERNNFSNRIDLGAVDRDFVYLTGETSQQIRLPMPFGQQLSLADALFEAGGVAVATGNPSQIYVLRTVNDQSPVIAWQLDGSNVVNMVLATRFELRPNDVVFVAEQPVTRWNRIIRQLTPSLILSSVSAIAN